MRSPLGTLLRHTPQNKAPVPLVSERRQAGWSNRLFGWNMGGASDETLMASYGSVGTLFAIVSRLATATAETDWHMHTIAPGEANRCTECDKVGVTLLEKHPALTVWNDPNPYMPRQEFVEVIQQHMDLTGETDWLVSWVGSMPIELWPMRPDKIEPIPHPSKFLSGYIYMGPDGQQIPLTTKQCLQMKMPNPLDPYRGMGPVQSILTDLDSTKYSAEWNRNFFLNSAQPGGVIQFDRQLSDEEFDEVTLRWAEQHKGIANAHRVAIIEGGQWVDRGFNMRDMQFAELRDVSRETIREAFGFPKPMLGAVDDVNRANAEAGEYVFARWLIVPRLERIKGTLNHDFLPLFGKDERKRFEFAYTSPVPPDQEREMASLSAKANALTSLVAAGFDAEQAAEVVGLPPMMWTKPEPTVVQAPDEDKQDKDKEDTPGGSGKSSKGEPS